jgi:hypothetical protein
MWLKTRRTNGLLAPLAAVISGEVSDGRLRGSYGGYSVDADPRRTYPIETGSPACYGGTGPALVNTFRVVIGGALGRTRWTCQSSAGSLLHGTASEFTAGPLLRAFKPGEFKFEGVDRLAEGAAAVWTGMVKRLGVPVPPAADQELQERLVAHGLFEELEALRWGAHPYLPKVAFTPPASELARDIYTPEILARVGPAVEQKLRAAGYSDFESLLASRIKEADQEDPGRLELEVEMGKEQVPTPERFREMLEHAVAIAELNGKANPSTAHA